MDNYGELTFQNAVDCLPLDVHLGNKCDMDAGNNELDRNDDNDNEYKMTFADISINDANTIHDTEVSLRNVIVLQHEELDRNDFLYTDSNASILPLDSSTDALNAVNQNSVRSPLLNQQNSGLQTIKNPQDDNTQIISINMIGDPTNIVPEIQQNSLSDIDSVHVLQHDNMNRLITITFKPLENQSNPYSQENENKIIKTGVDFEVDHAIENILNQVTTNVEKPESPVEEKKKVSHELQKVKSDKTFIGEKQHKCDVCGKCFREKSHLVTHSRAHVDIRNFSCEVCGQRFKTKSNLYFHSQTHSEAPFTCTECNKTYAERKILKRHMRVVHSFKELLKCNECDKTFKSAEILSLHYTVHTGAKPYKCSMCPKSFVYKTTLALHTSRHHECTSCLNDCKHRLKPWLCTVCGKKYSLKASLDTHMKSHNPDNIHKCTECPKTFVKKQSYEIHMKSHSGEGPQFMCDQCSQSYFNVFALRRHYLKHTSQRSFVCEVCSKAFWMKDALKVHMRSHSNEKPFKCTKCPKAFAHKHTLEGHLKTHRNNQEEQIDANNELCQTPTVSSISAPVHQSTLPAPSFLFYPLPPPLQPATHIVLTHSDQNTAQTLHVL
ncbi:hypothetical protein O3M35_009312 [Rhynocoris fuscipes]|uniref:C2H2-type domain-containing protein n=1 Tax=Rhynocoris fuscipes TaxID=488301 RepID=A0AAW1DA30_9HEMI